MPIHQTRFFGAFWVSEMHLARSNLYLRDTLDLTDILCIGFHYSAGVGR